MSSVQVLVATMHQNDFSKIDKMNIRSDVIFANQAETTAYEKIKYKDFHAEMVTTATRGVGLNRNIALFYATGDLLVLADDDMVYDRDYVEMVQKAFEKHPDADAVIFNIRTVGARSDRRLNRKESKVAFYNALNYGAARIAVRRESLMKSRICFSTYFGGGCRYSAGEDSLFICDMLRHGFKIYTSADVIATVDQSTSTWFQGYTEKYFQDKGAFYKAVFGSFALVMCLQDLIRHRKRYLTSGFGMVNIFRMMKKGAYDYK